MPKPSAARTREYREQAAALRAHVARTGAPCWLCGGPIDLDLPWKHAAAFTADHVLPTALGGPVAPGLAGLRPAHRACNARRGDTTRARPVARVGPMAGRPGPAGANPSVAW